MLTCSATSSGLTDVLLTRPDNLLVAYEPEMRLKIGTRQEDSKIQYNYFFGMYDFGYRNTDACAVAVNVKPTVDPSIAV